MIPHQDISRNGSVILPSKIAGAIVAITLSDAENDDAEGVVSSSSESAHTGTDGCGRTRGHTMVERDGHHPR